MLMNIYGVDVLGSLARGCRETDFGNVKGCFKIGISGGQVFNDLKIDLTS